MLEYNDLQNILNCIYNSIPIRVKAVDPSNGNEQIIEGMDTGRIYDQLDAIPNAISRQFTIKIGMG